MKNKVSLIVSLFVFALQASNAFAHPECRNHDYPTRQQCKHDTFLAPHANAVSSLIDELFAYETQPLLTKLEIKEIKATTMRSTILHYYNFMVVGDQYRKIKLDATYFLPEYLAQNIAKNARKLLEHIAYNAYSPKRHLPAFLAHEFEVEIKTMALDAMSSNIYGCLAPFVGTELEFLCNSFLASL